jgi:hypothetical protein
VRATDGCLKFLKGSCLRWPQGFDVLETLFYIQRKQLYLVLQKILIAGRSDQDIFNTLIIFYFINSQTKCIEKNPTLINNRSTARHAIHLEFDSAKALEIRAV